MLIMTCNPHDIPALVFYDEIKFHCDMQMSVETTRLEMQEDGHWHRHRYHKCSNCGFVEQEDRLATPKEIEDEIARSNTREPAGDQQKQSRFYKWRR